jgi:RNA polymerase sigma-70 factor, ECF subfamily
LKLRLRFLGIGFDVKLVALEVFLANIVDEGQGIALLKRIAMKDRKAFETFYFLYAEGLGRFLMKLLKQSEWVDEAVNDVMLVIWESADRYDPERGKLSTWLFGIAHFKALKILERNGRHREELLEDLQIDDDNYIDLTIDSYEESANTTSKTERIVMGWELGDAMTWAFSKLSTDHLAVINLCFAEDFSYQEIAEIVDCPINTVKTRLFHARKRLADLLAQKGFSLAFMS